MLKINNATIAELFNVDLGVDRPCASCGKVWRLLPWALLCYEGHIYYDCTEECGSTGTMANRPIKEAV